MYDIIIKNGLKLNNNFDIIDNDIICIKDGIIIDPLEKELIDGALRYIDATGCIITPGLIDSHIHVYHSGGSHNLNVSPDVACIPNSVTTCIDGGSAGPFTFESFFMGDILPAVTTVKAMLHMSFNGIMPFGWDEIEDPRSFDSKLIRRLWKKYPNTIIGLKIRMTDRSTEGMGTSPLKATVEMAEKLEQEIGRQCMVTCHVSDLAHDVEMSDIIGLLRRGDVFTHPYQNSGPKTLLDHNGKLLDCFWEGKEKGILFDSGCATGMFSVNNILSAFEQGFFPDLIGTDIVGFNIYKMPCMSMPFVFSMLYNMGMPLKSIFKALTVNAANAYCIENTGSLDTGKTADISIIKLTEKKITYDDKFGGSFVGKNLFLPMATIKNGAVVYQNLLM